MTNGDISRVADDLLHMNMKDIITLQSILAQNGVCMTLSTAEIQFLEAPSLGRSSAGSHDPLED